MTAQIIPLSPAPNGRFTRPTPRVSIVICTRGGAPSLGRTLESVRHLDYPEYEVLVVEDGNSAETDAIAEAHGIHPIHAPGRARAAGAAAATGAIVAFLEDDACPEPDWLQSVLGDRLH